MAVIKHAVLALCAIGVLTGVFGEGCLENVQVPRMIIVDKYCKSDEIFEHFWERGRYLSCSYSISDFFSEELTWSVSVNDMKLEDTPYNAGSPGYSAIELLQKTGVEYKCCANVIENATDCTARCSTCLVDLKYLEFTVARTSPTGPVQEGDDVTMTCTSDANPMFEGWVEWRRNLNPDQWRHDYIPFRKPVYRIGNDTIVLKNVTGYQTALYQCAGAINLRMTAFGSLLEDKRSNAIRLDVQYLSDITWNGNCRDWVGANQNEDASLVCSVSGNPKPKVTWYNLDNATVTNETSERMSREDTTQTDVVYYRVISRLNITEVNTTQDYGIYTCEASNEIGGVRQTKIQLRETGKPCPPINVRVHRERKRSIWEEAQLDLPSDRISILWDFGYDGGERHQSVYAKYRYLPDGGPTVRVIVTKDDQGVTTFENLTPDSLYEISLYSKNSKGTSEYATINAYTMPLSPRRLNIMMTYEHESSKLRLDGIPQDGDPETCVRIESLQYSDSEYYILPEFECIQHDGEYYVKNAITHGEHFGRYCHSQRCSPPSKFDRYMYIKPSHTLAIVLGTVGGVIVIVVGVVVIAALLIKKKPGCLKGRSNSLVNNVMAGEEVNQPGTYNLETPSKV